MILFRLRNLAGRTSSRDEMVFPTSGSRSISHCGGEDSVRMNIRSQLPHIMHRISSRKICLLIDFPPIKIYIRENM